MDVKTGTQTWSKALQRTDFKPDNDHRMSAVDQAKFFDNQSIGDTLNKIADPNFVEEKHKLRAVGSDKMGKDAFMKLLLAQMKNQDPTNPMKNYEMASQLAQFTQLEKLTNINQGINALHKGQTPQQNLQALAFIGKAVKTDNSKIDRSDAKSPQTIRFSIPREVQKLTMKIKGPDGKVIRTLTFRNLKAGNQELVWNGKDESGKDAPAGSYKVEFTALASNGHKIFVDSKTEGVITGVNFTPMGPQLLIGKQVVNMSDVKSITDPATEHKNVHMLEAKNAIKKAPVKKENGAKYYPIEAKAPKVKSNLNDLAMTQGLINKLNKAGAKAGGMAGS